MIGDFILFICFLCFLFLFATGALGSGGPPPPDDEALLYDVDGFEQCNRDFADELLEDSSGPGSDAWCEPVGSGMVGDDGFSCNCAFDPCGECSLVCWVSYSGDDSWENGFDDW